LGDGECDGIDLQHTLHEAGWSYVCRTGSHVTAAWDGTTFRLDTVGWCIKPGTLVALAEATMTRETIESIAVERPDATPEAFQGMCLDKG
jgi:hypothetical protein